MKGAFGMAMVTLKFRIDADLYEECSKVLAKSGLTIELATVMFFEECVRRGDLPFPYTSQDLEEARQAVERLEKETGQKALEVIYDEPDPT